MAYLTFITTVVLLVVMQLTSVNTCSYPQQYQSNDGTYSDYFLGQMKLTAAINGRRKRNVIWPWTLSHSMLLFRGKVFEWGIKSGWRKTFYMNRRPSSCKINWHWGRKGYSKCLLSDAVWWTRAYGRRNRYHLLLNNCHMFVNRLARYLDTNCGR